MPPTPSGVTPTISDALVVFGVTGDLAKKKIFPSLYAMAKHGDLKVPVVGVSRSELTDDQLRDRATESIKADGKIDDKKALDQLALLPEICIRRLQRPGYVHEAQAGARG